ncbi:WD repeat-containing protein 75, partial [Sarracenia purpurea var. burkii]
CLSLREDGRTRPIILENLIDSGYRLSSSKVFLDLIHLKLTLEKLGEFHAYSYQAKKSHGRQFFDMVDNLIETHHTCTLETPGQYYDTLNDKYFEALSGHRRYRSKIPEIRRILKKPVEFFETTFTSRDEPEAVICHGDFLRNNLLFRYNALGIPVQVKFVDLANSRYCSPVVDLATILYMNTDQNTRNLYWNELIDTYYTSLKNTFPDNDLVPGKSQIMAQFRSKALLGYLSVSFFIPYMLEYESNPRSDWLTSLFSPEFEQYKELSWFVTPGKVSACVILKMAIEQRVELVVDVLKDIIDRGFV